MNERQLLVSDDTNDLEREILRSASGDAPGADAREKTLRALGIANGFSFEAYDAGILENTLHRACEVYRQLPTVWQQIVETGMGQDWSWTKSAREYIALYEKTLARKRQNALAAV